MVERESGAKTPAAVQAAGSAGTGAGRSGHAGGGKAPTGHQPDSRVHQTEELFETQASWSISSGDLLCLHTGDWRTERPVFIKEKCNACGFCYIYCPIQCIVDDEDGIHYAADMEYCKGCGVCAKECPKDAIVMTPEGGFDECGV
jgi:pyruvate ferredoxin oxidoreductase delta subunit